MSGQSSIERAEAAVAAGQAWRAKEILQGRIASHPFEPEVCESLGRVLLSMGDLLEAGRYLFISGFRRPEYQEAIDVFLERFAKASARQFHATLPSRARIVPVAELPADVVRELERRGLSAASLQREVDRRRHPDEMSRTGQVTTAIIGVSILAVFIVGFVHGISVIIRWLF